jgi:predicted negative regulator of RcsB-dependent stress response
VSTDYHYAPRGIWTLEEIAQVRQTFGDAEASEALDLFAPDDWQVLYENMAGEDLVSERDRLQAKTEHYRAAEAMGIGDKEAAIMRVRAMMVAHEEGSAPP